MNCILRMVTGINVAYGQDDYQRAFREQGGQSISLSGGMRGDIIQVGNGVHTAIILQSRGDRTYQVVDSNWHVEAYAVEYDRQAARARTREILAAPCGQEIAEHIARWM